ncbi:hypothetical protein KI387_011993, partial [Taxus chinensis]
YSPRVRRLKTPSKGSVVGMWVARIDDVSEVDAEVELTDWEADESVVEVMAVVGMGEVCVVEVAAAL